MKEPNAKAVALMSRLKADGHRLTKVRSAVIETLAGAAGPVTAAEVGAFLKKLGQKCDRVTVYRELTFLVKERLASQVRFASGAARFELASGHHHHLVCTGCDSAVDVCLGEETLSREMRAISRKNNFKVLAHALEFYGLCQKCSAKR